MVNQKAYEDLTAACNAKNVTLVAVSKTKPVSAILELYDLGHRDFGENYVQELIEKEKQLPKDIRWHFIGHLQTNKVKQVIGLIHLIHGVDSLKLLKEINKQSEKINKITQCLLQVHIAQEETKFGLDENELKEIIDQITTQPFINASITGLMGMASFTGNKDQVRNEFKYLKSLQTKCNNQTLSFKLETLSMGMTADYKIAVEEGSNLIRVGSLIFGERNYQVNDSDQLGV